MQTDRTFIDDMTKMIIRPHRDVYTLDKLGPSQIIVKGRSLLNRERPSFKYIEITRKDISLDCKGKKLQVSIFTPTDGEKIEANNRRRCVVYLHANSGSRIQGLDLVKYIVPYGWSMAIFDYRGSGLSDGDYTSMGINESQDLEKVLLHLVSHERMIEFSLWGRSMGAVTALYYLTKQYFWNNIHSRIVIIGIVLDSPFANMQKLMFQIGSSKISLPQFVFGPIIASIMQRVTSKIGVNLKELDLVEKIKTLKVRNADHYNMIAKVSSLFLTSLQDRLVNSSHVQKLHQIYPFKRKELFYFNGQHSDNRSDSLKQKCSVFLCEANNFLEEKMPVNFQPSSIKKSEIQQQKQSKETQYLLAPRVDKGSPKLRPKKERVMTQETYVRSKESIKSSKIIQQARKGRVETQPQFPSPTIVINNNYNVSVNLYQPRRQSIQNIPPITFSRNEPIQAQHGYMTDRLSENNLGNKYYITHTAKTEKRDHHQFVSNSYSHPFSMQQQIQPTTTDMEHMFTKNEHNRIHRDQTMEIPRIKFEGIDYNVGRQEQIRDKLTGRDSFERCRRQNNDHKIGPPPQLQRPHGIQFRQLPSYNQTQTVQMHSSTQIPSHMSNSLMQDSIKSELGQKAKLSLVQLRKLQKREQQKCVTRVSKVMPMRESKQFQQLEKFELAEPANEQAKLRPSLQEQQKDIKLLKTSLMGKRKVVTRKNSDANDNMKGSYLIKKHEGDSNLDKESSNSLSKVLQFKVKIEHL